VPSEIERLYREQRAGLVRLVERELRDHDDAEDVVQTAFLDAQRALERGTIPRNPRAWLAAIALNAAHRLRRRRLNAEPLEDYAVQEALGTSELHAALSNLPSEQRAAVLYRDLLGLSYRETADQMGTSVNAVTMLLHRGRKRLRQTIGVSTAGLGLWRWLKRVGMPQVAAAKAAAAVVVAAGLATTGVVAARVVAPVGSGGAAASPARTGSLAAAAPRTAGDVPARDSAPRGVATADRSRTSAAPLPSTQGSESVAIPAAAAASTTADASSSTSSLLPSVLQAPPVSVSATLSTTVSATVAVSTPIATVTVSTPTGTTATVTTPILTVTVPIP
jgi:RNA polymerase sigma-70 factor (ECF subfamily)